jgi:hypothetical protein
MSKGVIFQELRAHVGTSYNLSPLLAFYAFESPLFYSHHNHDGNVTISPSAMGTHQNDPLGGALFALTHLKALHFMINYLSSYLFPFITNDIHIIGPPSIV